MKALLVTAMLVLSTAASAQSVRDLAWMTGDRKAGAAHEVWIDGGDMLLGASVTVENGKAREYEHLRVGRTADGKIAYFALLPDRPAVVFPLKSLSNRRAVFENPTHDFPQRVIYWDAGNGNVGARIEGTIGGKPQSQEWLFKPVR